MSNPFIDRLYREVIALATQARDYSRERMERDALEFPAETCMLLNLEYLRVTNRLMQAVAWLMAQKAAVSGGMARTEACGPHYMPDGEQVCLAPAGLPASAMPPGLEELLDRSLSVYGRTRNLAVAASTVAA